MDWVQANGLVSPWGGTCPEFLFPAGPAIPDTTRVFPGGILMSRVFQGSTDASVFEDFIEQLLRHCGRWPEPKSVLVMDNASFHHTEQIRELCSNAGVKLLFLPPYSLDLSPIEKFFAELKAFVRRNWQKHACQNFRDFLEWSADVVGGLEERARKVIFDMRA